MAGPLQEARDYGISEKVLQNWLLKDNSSHPKTTP